MRPEEEKKKKKKYNLVSQPYLHRLGAREKKSFMGLSKLNGPESSYKSSNCFTSDPIMKIQVKTVMFNKQDIHSLHCIVSCEADKKFLSAQFCRVCFGENSYLR